MTQQAQEILNQAMTLHTDGNLAEAEKNYRQVLEFVPNSVLWLRGCRDYLLEYAKKSGVNTARIVGLSDLPNRASYYERHSLIDLGLDTPIYNGGSTVCDALWAETPVITVVGHHYASRMAAGILNGIGMYDDLVVSSLEEYKIKALELANNPEKLANIKNKLKQNKTTTALFNTERQVRNFENLYRQMWQRHISNLPPDTIEVSQ